MRAALGLALVLGSLALPAALPGAPPLPSPAALAPPGLLFLRGDLHAHTCYSDGELMPDGRPSTPADAFRAVKEAARLDFFAVTEHAEWLNFPFCARPPCINTPLQCYASPLPGSTEWQDVLEQARASTDAGFVALRGFEWSHPLEGHFGVLGSQEFIDAWRAPHQLAFYAWLLAPPPIGGSDGIAAFNHPGREPLMFDDFAYVAPADAELQLLEVYNRGNVYDAAYVRALDKGWHVAPIGVSDSHSPSGWLNVRGHTVVLARERSEAAVLEALDAMRTYATNDADLLVLFRVGEALMGSAVAVPQRFTASVSVLDPTPGDGLARVSVLANGGAVAASLDAAGAQGVAWEPSLERVRPGEEWFLVKVEGLDGQTAFTAPIWTTRA